MNNWHNPILAGITNALNGFQSYLNNIYINYYETIKNTLNSIANKFAEIADNFKEWAKPYWTINLLGENQYVYWDYLDDDFIDLILDSENINKKLRKINTKANFSDAKNIASKCMESPYMKPYERLFLQSLNAFETSNCELAILGFISVIDGLLSDVSSNSTTSVFKRADTILKKIENSEEIDNDDYAVVVLAMTFRATTETFCQNSDFTKKEPKFLNRHWIMHGRSRRRKTKLDCIKMIRFIYGIILIDKLAREEEAKDE